PPAESETAVIEIVYPTEFDLFTAGDVATATADFQAIAAKAGVLPLTEGLLLSRLMRLSLPGMSDTQYAECDAEIAAYLAGAERGGGSGDPPVRTDPRPAPPAPGGPAVPTAERPT